VLYIREAHAADSPRPKPGAPKEPRSEKERCAVASGCVKDMGLTIPFLIDDMENTTEAAYAAWPDRLYVIGADGRVAYKGGLGPKGFKPDEADSALARLLGEK
jgi:hypothetical protein